MCDSFLNSCSRSCSCTTTILSHFSRGFLTIVWFCAFIFSHSVMKKYKNLWTETCRQWITYSVNHSLISFIYEPGCIVGQCWPCSLFRHFDSKDILQRSSREMEICPVDVYFSQTIQCKNKAKIGQRLALACIWVIEWVVHWFILSLDLRPSHGESNDSQCNLGEKKNGGFFRTTFARDILLDMGFFMIFLWKGIKFAI